MSQRTHKLALQASGLPRFSSLTTIRNHASALGGRYHKLSGCHRHWHLRYYYETCVNSEFCED